ncbi:MAG: hypothetical protein CMC04_08390 [Flavobacteriaceae bacterium]|nr:hypothetical protein [Flavobacteriaceae bacterium]|tara:strand:- start:2743 stop:4314 length:1572 start_codon:yes stop_codon:yes gene_type:complete
MKNKNSLFIRMLDNTNIDSTENENSNIMNNNDFNNDFNNANNKNNENNTKNSKYQSKKEMRSFIKEAGIEYEQYFNYNDHTIYHVDPDDYMSFDISNINTRTPHTSFFHSFLQSKNSTLNISIPENEMFNTMNNGKTISNMIDMNNVKNSNNMNNSNNPNNNIKYPPHSEPNNKSKFTKVKPFTIKDVVIDEKIDTVEDLINIINKYPYNPFYKYNFNLKALHNIKKPLEMLNGMVGMQNLKKRIVEQLLYFIQGFHVNNKGEGDYMHTVIFGPPGTGKTEIAKIMGDLFSKLGVLQNNKFRKVTRSDLVAGYLGQTAIKTTEVIKDCLGGVLFIDEAYSLGNTDKIDSFSKECVDTLCESLSNHKDNLMVIIAGYEKELDECFFKINQGMKSRFVWRFETEEYNGEDLFKIFMKKVSSIEWSVEGEKKESDDEKKDQNNNAKYIDWFVNNKEHFSYYGRDVEGFLSKVKIAHSKRVFKLDEKCKKVITLADIKDAFEVYKDNKSSDDKQTNIRKEILYSIYS